MSRRRGENLAGESNNGYAETDPTGRYGRFDEVLGKGAMKTVYRAFDERNGMEVAWNQAKICDVLRSQDALQRMYSEVHLLSTLQHESIITFHTSWIDVGKRTFNFITELFTSGTLREYRQRYPRVDIRAVKNWARQILHGLVYLHNHDPPVIHRDIKCDNIFVNGHLGQVKIGDLGLAAVLRGSQSAHSVIGTPEFMAPELYEEDYNELVDIYSFGMCMLEMLTSEYPYSECSNPAQIYKKVTSGKLPDAYHRIKDPEAQRFISRCLETAANRSSAEELLLDPFLTLDENVVTSPKLRFTGLRKDLTRSENFSLTKPDEANGPSLYRTDMTITGKLNPDDETIFLKVQIAEKEGQVRNIYFPFDILSDTPLDVANEMVKELDITDWEPTEIAEMIEAEISLLVPGWSGAGGSGATGVSEEQDEYTYNDENEDGNNSHPFYYLSSSPNRSSSPNSSSSLGSLFSFGPASCSASSSKGLFCQGWLQDDLYTDDDDSSTHSCKYSAVNYCSGNEQDPEPNIHQREAQARPNSPHNSTRFGLYENPRIDKSLAYQFQKQCHIWPDSSSHGHNSTRGRRFVADGHRMMRNRSMVDIRSQLLHRTLVEELNKRLFNTVGSVENIGFQVPCYDTSRHVSRSGSSRANHRRGKHKGRE